MLLAAAPRPPRSGCPSRSWTSETPPGGGGRNAAMLRATSRRLSSRLSIAMGAECLFKFGSIVTKKPIILNNRPASVYPRKRIKKKFPGPPGGGSRGLPGEATEKHESLKHKIFTVKEFARKLPPASGVDWQKREEQETRESPRRAWPCSFSSRHSLPNTWGVDDPRRDACAGSAGVGKTAG